MQPTYRLPVPQQAHGAFLPFMRHLLDNPGTDHAVPADPGTYQPGTQYPQRITHGRSSRDLRQTLTRCVMLLGAAGTITVSRRKLPETAPAVTWSARFTPTSLPEPLTIP